MANRKHDLYYYLSIALLIALLFLWAWWAGENAVRHGDDINMRDWKAEGHYRAVMGLREE